MYFLGLDISSSKCGIFLSDQNKNLILSEGIKFNLKYSLEKRAEQLEQKLSEIQNKYEIDMIFLEEALIATFGGKGNANTSAILNVFSGMARYIVFKVFGKEAILINVRSARKILGIKISRGIETREVKNIIIKYVINKYEKFEYTMTKFNNFAGLVDDRADACVILLGGLLLTKQNCCDNLI